MQEGHERREPEVLDDEVLVLRVDGERAERAGRVLLRKWSDIRDLSETGSEIRGVSRGEVWESKGLKRRTG